MIARELFEDENGSIEVISLDRPDKRNAMLPDMLGSLAQAVEDSTARALVVAGNGPTFCAGFDLDACDADLAVLDALLVGLARAIDTLRAARQPVVMAVQGAAVAGGCALLGAADVVVSHASAKLGYPVLRIGVSPAVSAPTLAPRIGTARARELMLRPDLIDGSRAHEIGLVDEIVGDPSGVLPAAIQRARTLCKPSTHAQAQTASWVHQLDAVGQQGPRALAASRSLVGSDEQQTMLRAALRARKEPRP